MAKKKKIRRLNKEYYVTDEYGHTDAVMVQKINELIGVINYQLEVINSFELLLKHQSRTKKLK